MGTEHYPKINLKWPVVIQNGGHPIERVTLNLNPNQVYICCAKPLKLREITEISINVPQGTKRTP